MAAKGIELMNVLAATVLLSVAAKDVRSLYFLSLNALSTISGVMGRL